MSILMSMSTRLQIIVQDEEARELRRCAKREGLSLSDWVRRALRRARREQTGPTARQRLAALNTALQCNHPTGEIDEILSDIERGRDLR
jgi:hypothetical protein